MRNSLIKKISNLIMSTTGFLVVLLMWMIMSGKYHPLILPSPRETLEALVDLLVSGALLENILITVRRTMIGYLLANITGIILALILYRAKKLQKILRPLITVIQTTPPVIWLALAVIWFGIAEDITPIFLIFIVTLPIIFINISEGLEDIDQKLVEMARAYSADWKQIILDIYFPSLVTHLASAISIGFAFAWKSSIFAEYIGSSSGVGYALSVANNNLETAQLYAWAIVLISLMLLIEYLLIKPVQKRATGWRYYG